MKEHPIIFNMPMIQAILKGRKTQTRRVIKPQPGYPYWCGIGHGWDDGHGYEIKCPYEPGDILWVRETWADIHGTLEDKEGRTIKYIYKADDTGLSDPHSYSSWGIKWCPSIYMPREAARVFLKVTNIRVERLQDISEQDAISEGVLTISNTPEYQKALEEAIKNNSKPPLGEVPTQRFRRLWDSINEKRGYGWDTNPYVWVVKFERVVEE